MKRIFLTCLLATTAALPAMAAEAVKVSISLKQFVTQQCIVDQDCTGFAKGNVSFSATIDLTPEEEAGLQEETSVTLDLDEFEMEVRLGEDPNFDTGDTSAKIKTQVDVSGDIKAEANVQLKWGDGQLKIKLSLPFAGEDIVNKTLKNKDTKEPNGLDVAIIAVNGLTPVFTAETFVTGDTKQSAFQLESAEGDQTAKRSFSFKSRVVPVAP
jgi:hypothetical protein